MKKIKSNLRAIVSLILFCIVIFACHPQSGQTNSVSGKKIVEDAVPDSDLVASLENMPNATDTVQSNTVIVVKNHKVDLATYFAARSFFRAKRLKAPFTALSISRDYAYLATVTPAQDKLAQLIDQLRKNAINLCYGKFNLNDGTPAQTKIGYSWGSKEFIKRQIPPGEKDHCGYSIHGLDCSGFIFQLFLTTQAKIPEKDDYADMERRPDCLTKALKPYFGNFPYQVNDLDSIPPDQMRSGDIIYFRNHSDNKVSHIAIVLENKNGEVKLFECIGAPNACQTNLEPGYGVVEKVLATALSHDHRKHLCVRITAF